MTTNLTVETITEAMKGNDFWLNRESDAAKVVEEATRQGFIKRLSHTQAQWTEVGLAKARAELAVCVCGMARARHTDGEDGNRVNERTARGAVTLCQGFQAKKCAPHKWAWVVGAAGWNVGSQVCKTCDEPRTPYDR